MKIPTHSLGLRISTVLGLLLVTSGAVGQEDDRNDSAESNALEVVVVTAQKREQNLQDVPIAITVFSQEALNRSGIVDMQGISMRTPSFYAGQKDAASSQFSIRGIGSTDDGAAADNSVIVYVDEVPIGRAAGMDLDLFDLERVEVLRGPQGTLFGRNAVGGAISLVTKKPTEEFEADFETTVGDFNRLDFRGRLSGQIAENLYGKVSLSSRNRDGVLDSTIDEVPNSAELFPNRSQSLLRSIKALDIDVSTIRGALRYVPSEALEINLSAAISTLDQAGPQRVFIGENQDFGRGGDALLPGLRGDFHKEFFEDPGFAEIDTESAAANINYSFANGYQLTSISSYRKVDSAVNDVISTEAQTRAIMATGVTNPVVIAPAANDFSEISETFTQELRVMSPDDQPLRFVAGVFYLHENVHRNETVNLGLLQRLTDGSINVLAPPGESGDNQFVSVDSYAAFAEASYELFTGLDLTLGGRFTRDEKDITRIGTADGIVVANPFFVQNSATFEEFTPKAMISYKPIDNLMAFASYSQGFKSGGFQGRGTTALAVSTPFGPEIADSYEFGIKATLFGGRLLLNPTVFHTDFSDLQVVELLRPAGSPQGTTSSLITQNAANADVDGFELEYSFFPFDGFELSGTFSFLDAEFVEFFAPAGFESESGAALTDRVGNSLPGSPDFSTSHLMRYTLPTPVWSGYLTGQVEYIHKDKAFGDVSNNPDVVRPEYDVFNLRLTYQREATSDWSLALWVNNVGNEDYLVNNFAQDGGGRALPADPRTFGATFRWAY